MRRWKFFKSKAVNSKVHMNTEMVILGVFMFFILPRKKEKKVLRSGTVSWVLGG